jgi:hypothetical protein
MTPQDRQIYLDVHEAIESGDRVIKASSTMEEDLLGKIDISHVSQGPGHNAAEYNKRIAEQNAKPH